MHMRITHIMLKNICGCILVFMPIATVAARAQQPEASTVKPRVVITADPELDDNNTIIRAVLYSADVKFEGLIYVSSEFHWAGDGKGTTQYIPGREYTRIGLCPCTVWRFEPDEHFIDNIVDAYAKSYPNLKVHDPDYPSPAELKSKIKWGNIQFDGDFSKDTDGSNLIKSLLLDNEPGPLYVTAQGGESTIARALKSIHDQFAGTAQWDAIRDKVSRKLIIIPSGDQDNTGAQYIRPNWPEVREYSFMGGAGLGLVYGAQDRAAPESKIFYTPEWMKENVLDRGPLGALERVWGDGKQMTRGFDRYDYFGLSGYTAEQLQDKGYLVWLAPHAKGSFLGEGDTGTFLNLIPVGLRSLEDPAWGGWAGRMRTGGASLFGSSTPLPVLPADTSGVARGLAPAGSNANAPAIAPSATKSGSIGLMNFKMPPVPARTAALNARFFAAAENDFAARLHWSVTQKFSDANHPPKVTIRGPLDVSARPGSTVRLVGEVSDPDHNAVATTWWQYNDAGTYPGDITISDPAALTTTFRVPDDAKPGQTIHVILEGTDNGTPQLTRYQRVVVTVQ